MPLNIRLAVISTNIIVAIYLIKNPKMLQPIKIITSCITAKSLSTLRFVEKI